MIPKRRNAPRLALLLLLAVLDAAAARAADTPASLRISIEDLFGRAPLEKPRLSPSGRYLAGIVPDDDAQKILVLDTATLEQESGLLVSEKRKSGFLSGLRGWGERRIAGYWWVHDDALLVSIAIRGGGETRLMFVDRSGSRWRTLNEREIKAGLYREGDRVASTLPGRKLEVALSVPAIRNFEVVRHDLFRLNVETGKVARRKAPGGYTGHWYVDASGKVRATVAGGSSPAIRYRVDGELAWATLDTIGGAPIDPAHVRLLAVSGGRHMYLASRHESDRFAVYRFDMLEGGLERIFAHPEVDVTGPLIFDGSDRLVGVRYVEDFEQTYWVDPAWRERARSIDEKLPGRLNTIESFDRTERIFAVRSESDRDPPEVYLYEDEGKRLRQVRVRESRIDRAALVDAQPFEYTGDAELPLHAYLALPPDAGNEPLPLVVRVHDGPASRAKRGFDPELQFLTSRGYAVLTPNYRGSTGYGRGFEEAGFGQWGGAMQRDLALGVEALVERGLVDPARVCIYGKGYGGYAALMAAIQEPGRFRCVAAHAPITDLKAFLADQRPHPGYEAWQHRLEGTKPSLRAASPITHAKKFGTPVLLSHGAQDHVVDPDQTAVFSKGLKKSGHPHGYYRMRHVAHEIERQKSAVEYYTRLEDFLARHLDATAPEEAEAGAGAEEKPAAATPDAGDSAAAPQDPKSE